MLRFFVFTFLFFTLSQCYSQSKIQGATRENLKEEIVERSKLWGQAVREKNTDLLLDLYDKDAHYLPDKWNTIHGREAIVSYWKSSLDFLGDVELHMETLEGTKQIIYETGRVTVQVMNMKGEYDQEIYSYTNVWKQQDDGRYQVVIDMFNELSSEE